MTPRWMKWGALCGALGAACAEPQATAQLTGDSEATSSTSSALTQLQGKRVNASRFLAQATFGPTEQALDDFTTPEAWLAAEFAKPTPALLARVPPPQHEKSPLGSTPFRHAFFTNAITGDAQLRQRVAFALSELFVISVKGARMGGRPAGFASFHDLLMNRAFGSYRELLEGVTLHPMMGQYLSMLGNDKATGNQLPDENFAREIMQLFSIGLYVLDDAGRPAQPLQETYSQQDIAALARVFTGWSWACVDANSDGVPDRPEGCWNGTVAGTRSDREVLPMQAHAAHHEAGRTVLFEGKPNQVVIEAGTTPEVALGMALDALAAHPNVGPFIGRQLIQRLTTSNPSDDYVRRVTAAFNTGQYTSANGRKFGNLTRGNLKAVVAAVLLDAEARGPSAQRLREPVLRLTAALRAFDATPVGSCDAVFRIANLETSSELGQMPYAAPSVFNFFRPGFSPRNTEIFDAGLVAPEFQITDEVSTAGYANTLLRVVDDVTPVDAVTLAGPCLGQKFPPKLAFSRFTDADTDEEIVRHVRLLLTADRMSSDTFTQLVSAVGRVQSADNKRRLATYLTLVSPDFLIQ